MCRTLLLKHDDFVTSNWSCVHIDIQTLSIIFYSYSQIQLLICIYDADNYFKTEIYKVKNYNLSY